MSSSCGVNSAGVLAVHVVEDHNEALPHIYRAIAAKILPFNGTLLLHFDAHPDLLSPDIKADDVTNKDLLFGSTSIADWILPAIYMGHFGRVVWVKPPWANQVPDGSYQLCVGKDKTSGQIRVSSPLTYFTGELLSVGRDELENQTNVTLDVVTLSPPPVPLTGGQLWPFQDPQTCPLQDAQAGLPTDQTGHLLNPQAQEDGVPNPKQLESFVWLDTDSDTPPPAKKAKPSCEDRQQRCCQHFNADLVNAISSAQAWVLDVDLDFFSTGNPYRSPYSEEQYELLWRLYQLKEPAGSHEEAVKECVEDSKRQLDCLERMWAETPVARGTKTELNLSSRDEALIGEMKALLGSIHNDSFIDTEYLHISGMMTDLPVHSSSEEEVAGLVSTVATNLMQISNKPGLVTIARSTEDEYTPASQVGTIQQQVLDMLHSVYGNGTSHHSDPQDSNGASHDTDGASCDPRDHSSKGNNKALCDPQDSNGASCNPQQLLPLQVYHHYNTKLLTHEPPGDICDCTYL